MKWKTVELQVQFLDLHPEVRRLVLSLDAYSDAAKLPEVVVTHVLRTPEQQEDIYWRNLRIAKDISEDEARAQARKKFSWHMARCAVDIRNSHYTPDQLSRVMAYLRPCCPTGPWELLQHDVGRGDHIHIGRKDFSWRKKPPAA